MQDFLNIALIQYDIEWLDITSNLQKLDVFFARLEEEQDIIILPEMFLTGFTMSPEGFEVKMHGAVIEWLKSKAVDKNALIVGSLIVKEGSNYYNRCLLVYPDGTISYQDKRHLFRYAGEDKAYTPARKRQVFEWRGWRIFCAVCYDLRFPVWTRNDLDYELLIYVANWPKVRIGAWRKLLIARAIENLSYVAGVNRTGVDGNGLAYDGNSTLVRFDGDELANVVNKSTVIYEKLDFKALRDYRNRFRFLEDRDTFFIDGVV